MRTVLKWVGQLLDTVKDRTLAQHSLQIVSSQFFAIRCVNDWQYFAVEEVLES